MKGYKVFTSDWACRGFQYEVGKTYVHEGDIKLCDKGFHFCEKANDCFDYYSFDSDNKVAEIEALGEIKTDGKKSVTDKITIVREISWHELLDLINTGKGCTGMGNSGDCNSGDYNSGNRNSGNYNSGDCNSEDCNSGDYNSGDFNSGDCNSGDCNSGDCNSGHYNSGDCNSGDYNSGFFCSSTPTATFFDKPTSLTFNEAYGLEGIKTIRNKYQNNIWVSSDNMSDSEKEEHPDHEATGGYLKVLDYKEAWKKMWKSLSEKEKQSILDLPNFDKDIFFDITGIRIEKGVK